MVTILRLHVIRYNASATRIAYEETQKEKESEKKRRERERESYNTIVFTYNYNGMYVCIGIIYTNKQAQIDDIANIELYTWAYLL